MRNLVWCLTCQLLKFFLLPASIPFSLLPPPRLPLVMQVASCSVEPEIHILKKLLFLLQKTSECQDTSADLSYGSQNPADPAGVEPSKPALYFVMESKFILIRCILYWGDLLPWWRLVAPLQLAQYSAQQLLLLFSRPDRKVEGLSLGQSTHRQRPSLFRDRDRTEARRSVKCPSAPPHRNTPSCPVPLLSECCGHGGQVSAVTHIWCTALFRCVLNSSDSYKMTWISTFQNLELLLGED